MKKILKFLLPYKKGLILSMIAITVSTVCDLLLPTIMSEVLNNGVYGEDMNYILRCCAAMLVTALIGLASVLLGTWVSTRIVAGFCADVRSEVFRRINSMSFEQFGAIGTGALVTRATHDVETVSWVAAELSGTVMTVPVLFVGGVLLALSKDVFLSLTLLAFVPLILLVVMFVGRRIVPLWEKCDKYIDRQNDIMRQRLRGIRVIRAFNAENQEHDKIADATRIMADTMIASNVSMGLITPLATLLLNLAAVLIVYFGFLRMEAVGGLSGGDVFAIVQYVSLVSSGVIMGAFAIIMFPHANVAAGRIGQVLDAQPLADPIPPQDLQLSGGIVFDKVSFSYDGAQKQALKDVSLQICPGEQIAVIGGTGAGKSTLVSMLLGFRMPTAGEVRLDGIPTHKLSRHTMRKNMSCVLQSASVFSGTVRENVAMGDGSADESRIMDALADAQAMEFVSSFPDGIDHVIKQSGKNLSGGQKQRLNIARALVRNVPVYIFDDSFSALDFLTEAKLRSTLNKRLKGKTRIVITQRFSSAMHCDRIYVMDRGQIVGVGAHAELLETCEVYRQIHASQTGGGV